MKKLNKLQIKSERLMKNEELIALRGGFGVIICHRSWIWGGDCQYSGGDILCDEGDRLFCAVMCPGFTDAICVGGQGY